jgi:hypothetical protein
MVLHRRRQRTASFKLKKLVKGRVLVRFRLPFFLNEIRYRASRGQNPMVALCDVIRGSNSGGAQSGGRWGTRWSRSGVSP